MTKQGQMPSANIPLHRHRRTKIVATLGPASTDPDVIEKLFIAGVDVFRMNFSHGTHDDHRARIDAVRAIEKKTGRPIGIFADMQGPKLRVGKFKDDAISLTEGQKIRFDLDETPGDETRVNLPHPEIIDAMNVGSDLLIDDGKVRVTIREKGSDFLLCEVISGQKISNNKGVNVPGVVLPLSTLTKKDRVDLEAALDMGVDWIAQSFVQTPADVKEALALIDDRAKLIIKVEKPSAVEHIDEMIELADAVMLARGDLGVEIPPEDVPSIQKRIVRKVRQAGKPIIVATQMLESMIDTARPTRAEASDVATAVYDGTDAVMLSAETAAGKYPLEAVNIMDRITMKVESDETYRKIMEADMPTPGNAPSAAISMAAYQVAHTIGAAAMAVYTTSGSSGLTTARQRPDVPILCLTQNTATARLMTLSYAVHPVFTGDMINLRDMVEKATEIAHSHGMAKKGDRLVITAGVPFGQIGSTNVLRVADV